MTPDLRLKRVYEAPDDSDGLRVLVDRLWPRGLSKAKAAIDLWAKDVAPSDALRRWFNHEADKWPEFQRRYRAELQEKTAELDALRSRIGDGPATPFYGARDEQHNQAVALRAFLLGS